MANFGFLSAEWPGVFEAASRAEVAAHPDPRTACFYARRALELVVAWVYAHDRGLRAPYQDNLSALVHDPAFKGAVGEAVFNKARVLIQLGNHAVHSHRPVPPTDALTAVRELFHVGYWLARTYARGEKPPAGAAFDPKALPRAAPIPAQTLEQLQGLESSLRERDERLAALAAESSALSAELERLRAEIAAAKKAAQAEPDTHDYSEAETRDAFIDLLLKEAGWALGEARDREYEVAGMPNAEGKGYVDYVLWGDDGRPLAVVEAKRTKKSPHIGQQQAKLYADCLEAQFGQRPVIFTTNGYEHWLWDDGAYPPREVQGFYKKSELELLVQRRTSHKKLAEAEVDLAIADRYYQGRAIRKIAEAFERDRERKALLVMATGAGKTRTVIALCDLLVRCNWVKRVLFLGDRVALVTQAVRAFKKHLPDASPVNLVSDKGTDGRIFVSTYPTMMGLIDETADGFRRFGVGHFDLIVIDEAHRSVYQKYGAIFAYFDALLVGLTATPKDEIDANTYRLFDLESGVPTDAYSLEDGVADGHLLPPKGVSVPLKFQREGIAYKDLSEDEKAQWDAVEWEEDDGSDGAVAPHRVEAEAVNKWLFNADTVDKVLEHLMTRGQTVAGGDRLGKTIVFAKNQAHAEFIAQRFDANYPHHKGAFARVVHCGLPYAQTLIDDFGKADKAPHIAISVDMLDTGIDVPEVVNLVFFKLVRSKTKFWQMLGRGTRLCRNLFGPGPGNDKAFFYVFDYCQNLEFFSQNPDTADGPISASLGKRLFVTRLELIGVLDTAPASPAITGVREPPTAYATPPLTPLGLLRGDLAALLRTEVAAMNLDNFVVRPKRRLVEQYREAAAWVTVGEDARHELATHVAGLPTELEPEDEEAKRFDLLVLNLQLALLKAEPAFARLQAQLRTIAGLIEEQRAIPMIQRELALIQDVQSDGWWQDVTAPMLEEVRRKLRALVKLIEKRRRTPVYTDFEDQLGVESEVTLPVFGAASFERFRQKARAFLRAHENHVAIHKLRMNRPLTATDLEALEAMLVQSGVGSAEDWQHAKTESHGLGLFVRSLVGLDREAAKRAFDAFLEGKTLTANQLEFINLIVEHLTAHGVMAAELLYESPFTDVTPHGPDGLFAASQLDELMAILGRVRLAAIAA